MAKSFIASLRYPLLAAVIPTFSFNRTISDIAHAREDRAPMDDPRGSLDLPKLALGAVVVYYLARTVYRLFFHPLAGVPGPRVAAVSSLYEFYWDCIKLGRYHVKITEMHEKYGTIHAILFENQADLTGPIVRINPWEVHINDPAFANTLYTNSKLEKDPFSTLR